MSSWNEFRFLFRVWQQVWCALLREKNKFDGEFNGRLHFEGLEREELQMLLLRTRAKNEKHKNCSVRSYWPVDCFFLVLLMATSVDVQESRKRLQERIKTKKRSEKSSSAEEKKRSAHSRTHLQIRGLEATRLTNYSATANSALNWDVASTKWSSSPRADSLHHQFHCPRRCSREAYNTTSPSLGSGHRTGRRLWSLDPQPL